MIHTDTSASERSRATTVYFLYHEILHQPSKYSYAVSRQDFAQHLEAFRMANRDNERYFRTGITFDDGHASDFEVALPLLEAAGLKAHFFITAGWTGTKPGYMEWHAVEELHRAGHHVGAHGWSHKMLSRCSPQELRDELRRPKEALEQHLGSAINSMSLPGGRLTAEVLRAANEAGYKQIFTSVPKTSCADDAEIGRINVTGDTSVASLERLLRRDSDDLNKMARAYAMKLALRRVIGDTLYFKLWALRSGYVQEEELGA